MDVKPDPAFMTCDENQRVESKSRQLLGRVTSLFQCFYFLDPDPPTRFGILLDKTPMAFSQGSEELGRAVSTTTLSDQGGHAPVHNRAQQTTSTAPSHKPAQQGTGRDTGNRLSTLCSTQAALLWNTGHSVIYSLPEHIQIMCLCTLGEYAHTRP